MPPPRPTTTLPALLRDAATLARRTPDAHAIWVAGRVDPKLREQVMLAVAHANACRWCTLAHRQWALAEGVSDAELAALEGQHAEEFDRRTWAAVAWARHERDPMAARRPASSRPSSRATTTPTSARTWSSSPPS